MCSLIVIDRQRDAGEHQASAPDMVLVAPGAAAVLSELVADLGIALPARAGNRRFRLLSALRAHTKPP